MFEGIQFIGTQRSGSNLLRLMLNQHPLISAHHPPHLLKNFFPLLDKYGDINLFESRKRLVRDMCDWVEKNPVTWSPVVFDVDAITASSRTIVEIFRAIYLTKSNQDGSKIWCCKSTHNTKYLKELRSQLNPFYIYLYRDGRDVALSFKKAIVGPKHIYEIAQKWDREQQVSLEFLSEIPTNTYAKISYESLIQNPVSILKMLCNKLNVPYSKNMLEYYSSSESMLTSRAGRMWKNVSRPILKNNIMKFETEMSEGDIEIFESVAGTSLTKLGYDLQTSSLLSFTDSQLLSFNEMDIELRKISIDSADEDDKEHRKPQEEQMRVIMSRIDSDSSIGAEHSIK